MLIGITPVLRSDPDYLVDRGKCENAASGLSVF